MYENIRQALAVAEAHQLIVNEILANVDAALNASAPAKDAPKPKASAPKPSSKKKALTKANRKDFIAALPAKDRAAFAHASTRQLAAAVVAGTIKEPKGFVVGAGYRALVS